ncbi:MAG: DUF3786 domain-containing protein [Dehalococcoidales bacterium]|nr:DUF3786 domain-containing protein [Dehalococcoidales bacterium]
MIKKHSILPEQPASEYGHELAYQIAGEQLADIKDYAEQCRKSGARYIPAEKSVIISYLNDSCQISLPDGGITYVDNKAEIPVREKILVLHYFLRASGRPLTGNLITYKELQEGINYYPTFFKRAIEPIVNNFKDSPQKLLETAAVLGGAKSDYGDTAVTIKALPYVPLTIVLWQEDKEFPPDGNIMFDSIITDYLPTEDITIICEIIAWRLVRLLKTGGGSAG